MPFLIILSAPSGAGKTTIARALAERRDDVEFSISATTRAPRGAERDGVDYYFLDRATFQRRIDAGDFLEWAEYGGARYGTLRDEVDRVLRSDRHVLLDIEVQGARLVRNRSQNHVSIFILPPSGEELVNRLRERRTEGPESLARRFRRAVDEIAEAVDYDYIVINDDRERAIAEVDEIVDTEMLRPTRVPGLDTFMNDLRDVLARAADAMASGEE